MNAVYLKNFRNGWATNSSSTHSVVYRNKDEMLKDMNVMENNFYERYTETIAASREAKIKYIAANIWHYESLFNIMCALYPEMKQYIPLIEEYKKELSENYHGYVDEKFGMYTRGRLYFDAAQDLEASIDYLKRIIDDDDLIIVGGSDEENFYYDTINGHKEIELPANNAFKNGNYWVFYDNLGKRIRFTTEKTTQCIPLYPELIDLKITNHCEHGCKFCYMDSNKDGADANFNELTRLIYSLSRSGFDRHPRRIEFAIGGGNVLLYGQHLTKEGGKNDNLPQYYHLEKLFSFIKGQGHIINTTINAKDFEKITEDHDLKRIFGNYVSGLGISVSSIEDVELLRKYGDWFCNYNCEIGNSKDVVIHLIPELLGLEETKEIIKLLRERPKFDDEDKSMHYMPFYSMLFLGFKSNGRGKTQTPHTFTNDELGELFNNAYCVSIDTTFANTYREWLKANRATDYTVTWNEGEYSMYIDAVEMNAYKSSYDLSKPYNLRYPGYEHCDDTEWFTPDQAFLNIRKDNGFKNINDI